MVNTSNSGSGGPGFKPRPSRCFLRQELYSILSFFTQVYNWVPATYFWGVTLRWTSIPSRLRVLRFSPLLKTQHFQIPIRSGTHGHVSTSSYELLCASWVNKQFTIYNFLFLKMNSLFCTLSVIFFDSYLWCGNDNGSIYVSITQVLNN